MADKRIGIIINGATGGIAQRQHLDHALVPIIKSGGIDILGGKLVPDPILVGRNEDRLRSTANRFGLKKWTTNIKEVLDDPYYEVFFDAGRTGDRLRVLRMALEAGKHVYAEKPVAENLDEGKALLDFANELKLCHGVVQDKLSLPGLKKLKEVKQSGFLGQLTGFKLDFGYWVFTGHDVDMQRPSWNYRKATGGGLALDMYPHWRYILEEFLGPIKRVVSRGWTAIGERVDEEGKAFPVDVDDSNLTLVELESGVIGLVTSSWATRTSRDDLMTLQLDGFGGSAVAGLHRCRVQPSAATPSVKFDPNVDLGIDYRAGWLDLPTKAPFTNGYRSGWEGYLRHVVDGTPVPAGIAEGLRDVAFAHAVNLSNTEDRWVNMNEFV